MANEPNVPTLKVPEASNPTEAVEVNPVPTAANRLIEPTVIEQPKQGGK